MSDMDTCLDQSLEAYLAKLADRVRDLQARHGCYRSFHEGLGLLAEEVAELFDEVRARNPIRRSVEEEALDVATVALRMALLARAEILGRMIEAGEPGEPYEHRPRE